MKKKVILIFIFLLSLMLLVLFHLKFYYLSQSDVHAIVHNELVVKFTLKKIYLIQSTFKISCLKDENDNEVGEYGSLSDLKDEINLLFSNMEYFSKSNTMKYGDYIYYIYLPSSINGKEKIWLCYAYPKKYKLGIRIFAITEAGTIFFSKNYYGKKFFLYEENYKIHQEKLKNWKVLE